MPLTDLRNIIYLYTKDQMLEEIHYSILHDNISFSWYFRLMHINHAINVMYDVASECVLASWVS